MTATSSVAVLPVAVFPGASSTSSVTVNVTGVNATGATGTATAIGGTNAIVVGVYATGVINSVSASGSGQTQRPQGFLLGFDPIASSPVAGFIKAGYGSVAAPIGVFATGRIGNVGVGTIVYASGVSAPGIIGSVSAGGTIVITVSGVVGYGVVSRPAVVIGINTVAVFGTPIYALLGDVTVSTITGAGVAPFGVYAVGKIGTVYVRQYTPVSWVNINTVQSPGWRAVIT